MILDKCSIVIIPPAGYSARPKQLLITPDSDFKWLLQEATKLLQPAGVNLDFLIRQGSAEILLTDHNFEDFKKTAHLNKIIRIIHHDT